MAKILVTGMSGTGKSTVISELASLGHRAIDTDTNEWSEWRIDAAGLQDWVWREDRIRDLLTSSSDEALFVSGCKSNQGALYPLFDHVVLLTAPVETILDRIEYRTTNDYGKDPFERHMILEHIATVEPLLRRSANLVIDTGSTYIDNVIDQLVKLADRTSCATQTVTPGECGTTER